MGCINNIYILVGLNHDAKVYGNVAASQMKNTFRNSNKTKTNTDVAHGACHTSLFVVGNLVFLVAFFFFARRAGRNRDLRCGNGPLST